MSITKRQVQAVILAWLAMLGWDFLLHGGLLARFYVADSQFLLGPLEAFRRIPLGYFSFLLNAILLAWVLPRFELATWEKTFTFGLGFGFLTWGTFVIGLISISTIETPLAVAWIIGQAIEMGVGAVVIFFALKAASLRKLSLYVFLFLILAFVLTIILQNIGFAPAIQMPS